MDSESSHFTYPVTAKTSLSPASTAFISMSQGKEHTHNSFQSRPRMEFVVNLVPETAGPGQTVASLFGNSTTTGRESPSGSIQLQKYPEAVVPP